jgi:polyphosphate glucokinase
MKVLAVDIGGTHVKVLASGQTEKREMDSGPDLTARAMVAGVKRLARGWAFDVVSLGYPGPVLHDKPMLEPHNLAAGWVGFDFAKAFGKPVRILNDAAMQALGSYQGGRMLFLGLGTGLGTALVIEGEVEPLELAHLPYKKGKTFEDFVGKRGYERLGKRKWRKEVADVVARFRQALQADYVVLGGGNAKRIKAKDLPKGVELGSNDNAFIGGFRMWDDAPPAGAAANAPAKRRRETRKAAAAKGGARAAQPSTAKPKPSGGQS